MKKHYNLLTFAIVFLLGVAILLVFATGCCRMTGEIEVRVNGKLVSVSDLKCTYLSNEERKEDVTYSEQEGKYGFRNKGFGYGKYTYTFRISEKDLEVTPQFTYFKTNTWSFEKIYLSLDLNEANGKWSGIMTLEDEDNCKAEVQFDELPESDLNIKMGP